MVNNARTIIAGNWKMHTICSEARQLTEAIIAGINKEKDLPEIIVIPPSTGLQAVGSLVKNTIIKIGAQNMHSRDSGAFTGEISPLMLVDLGVKYVLIGHSERRQYFGETNLTVNQKLLAAFSHKLVPILCVGESLDEREGGFTDNIVREQITTALANVTANQLNELVIAYEPVWAIGTGKVCEAKEANRVIALIRLTLDNLYSNISKTSISNDVPILYGGSVNSSNAEELLAQTEINGALVGGASLKATEFLSIIKASHKHLRETCSHV